MSEDRADVAKADEDGRGGDGQLFPAGKPLSTVTTRNGRDGIAIFKDYMIGIYGICKTNISSSRTWGFLYGSIL